MKHWSRSYSRRNTRLLRTLLKDGRIVADPESGRALTRKGVPFKETPNWCGYLRFRFQLVRRGKRINAWFFVHKAIFISTNPKLRKGFEIDNVDFDHRNNRIANLQYIRVRENAARKNPKTKGAEPAF